MTDKDCEQCIHFYDCLTGNIDECKFQEIESLEFGIDDSGEAFIKAHTKEEEQK